MSSRMCFHQKPVIKTDRAHALLSLSSYITKSVEFIERAYLFVSKNNFIGKRVLYLQKTIVRFQAESSQAESVFYFLGKKLMFKQPTCKKGKAQLAAAAKK